MRLNSRPILILFALFALCLSTTSQAGRFDDGTVSVGGKAFDVAVANDHAERTRGLMFVQNMPEDAGMLFIFPNTQYRLFWMKNTLIPLDILYFDDNRQLINVERAVPCKSSSCPHYPSRGRARYVLELNLGISQRYDFTPGMKLELDIDQALIDEGLGH
jgi:hypothetical protein